MYYGCWWIFIFILHTDVDECKIQYPCSQICENIPGTFRCKCVEGYALERDKTSCKTFKSKVTASTLPLSLQLIIISLPLSPHYRLLYLCPHTADCIIYTSVFTLHIALSVPLCSHSKFLYLCLCLCTTYFISSHYRLNCIYLCLCTTDALSTDILSMPLFAPLKLQYIHVEG